MVSTVQLANKHTIEHIRSTLREKQGNYQLVAAIARRSNALILNYQRVSLS